MYSFYNLLYNTTHYSQFPQGVKIDCQFYAIINEIILCVSQPIKCTYLLHHCILL